MSQNPTAHMPDRPQLVAHGLRLGEHVIPIVAGSLHYYHMEVEDWAPALQQLRALGVSLVDTYVPWSVHEQSGGFDFGNRNPRLDVARFLKIAADLGLYAIIRPGPHVNAELTRFGIPERVVWDEACMARTASGARVILPVPPLAFPLPSYASEKFLAEVFAWYDAVGAALLGASYPDGPVVMLQVDNEAALNFRDGVFDQDYHDDAIVAYRSFLSRKYQNLEALRRLYKNPVLTHAKARPPERKHFRHPSDLPVALDWAEAQECMVARALERMTNKLREHFPHVLVSHNLPPGWEQSVLDPARLEASVDLLGADYYHRATPAQRRVILERTTELRARSEALGKPCYAAELGVGFPPYFAPHRMEDSQFTALTALAYGVQGFNLYMAVERDRWVGAPIGVDGTPREGAEFYRQLIDAIRRTKLYERRRLTGVSLVVPRVLRRLSRVLHAFDPVSPCLLAALTGDAKLGPSERDLGLPSSVVMDALSFLDCIQRTLDSFRVPYGLCSSDQLSRAIDTSHWTLVVSCSALHEAELNQVLGALHAGKAVTLGPHFPERDELLQPRAERLTLPSANHLPQPLLGLNEKAISRAVSRACDQLNLPRLQIDGPELHATLFPASDQEGPVAFLINPTNRDVSVSWRLEPAKRARDALTLEPVTVDGHTLHATIRAGGARMLEIDWDS